MTTNIDRQEAVKLFGRIGVLSGQMEMLREKVGNIENTMERFDREVNDRLDKITRSLADLESKSQDNKSNIKFLMLNAAIAATGAGGLVTTWMNLTGG